MPCQDCMAFHADWTLHGLHGLPILISCLFFLTFCTIKNKWAPIVSSGTWLRYCNLVSEVEIWTVLISAHRRWLGFEGHMVCNKVLVFPIGKRFRDSILKYSDKNFTMNFIQCFYRNPKVLDINQPAKSIPDRSSGTRLRKKNLTLTLLWVYSCEI